MPGAIVGQRGLVITATCGDTRIRQVAIVHPFHLYQIIFHLTVHSKARRLAHLALHGSDPEARAQVLAKHCTCRNIERQHRLTARRNRCVGHLAGIRKVLIVVPVYETIQVGCGIGHHRHIKYCRLACKKHRRLRDPVFIVRSTGAVVAPVQFPRIGVGLTVRLRVHRCAQVHHRRGGDSVSRAVLRRGNRVAGRQIAIVPRRGTTEPNIQTMVVFPGKTGRKGHYCISTRSGPIRVPDIGESVVVGLAPGSGRVGWRQSPVLKGRLSVRDADLVGPGKFNLVVIGVITPIFNFAVVVCPGFAKEVAASCIGLGLCHFGIGCTIVVAVRPQL